MIVAKLVELWSSPCSFPGIKWLGGNYKNEEKPKEDSSLNIEFVDLCL